MDLLSSKISAVKEVRKAMTELQQKIGRKGRLVAEGRDMGTVVFPDAQHKFYITASPEIRAERRYRERIDRGETVSQTEVAREIKIRDDQDTKRDLAPLRPAKDARIVDTTRLSVDQVVALILEEIQDGKN
jgi:cytidylate kinase